MRGPKPLLFVALPEMPFWKVDVPFLAETVVLVGSNPFGPSFLREKAIGADETDLSAVII
ncbi:MAG: hypothetical protein JSV90_06835 [Methanobacteriota archaeon]|nr:MAG: hypothetical protein JSV90_06835 [Euryarchaeota archaeon]